LTTSLKRAEGKNRKEMEEKMATNCQVCGVNENSTTLFELSISQLDDGRGKSSSPLLVCKTCLLTKPIGSVCNTSCQFASTNEEKKGEKSTSICGNGISIATLPIDKYCFKCSNDDVAVYCSNHLSKTYKEFSENSSGRLCHQCSDDNKLCRDCGQNNHDDKKDEKKDEKKNEKKKKKCHRCKLETSCTKLFYTPSRLGGCIANLEVVICCQCEKKVNIVDNFKDVDPTGAKLVHFTGLVDDKKFYSRLPSVHTRVHAKCRPSTSTNNSSEIKESYVKNYGPYFFHSNNCGTRDCKTGYICNDDPSTNQSCSVCQKRFHHMEKGMTKPFCQDCPEILSFICYSCQEKSELLLQKGRDDLVCKACCSSSEEKNNYYFCRLHRSEICESCCRLVHKTELTNVAIFCQQCLDEQCLDDGQLQAMKLCCDCVQVSKKDVKNLLFHGKKLSTCCVKNCGLQTCYEHRNKSLKNKLYCQPHSKNVKNLRFLKPPSIKNKEENENKEKEKEDGK
jgi:hypothetical protein